MRFLFSALFGWVLISPVFVQAQTNPIKQAVIASVDEKQAALTTLSDEIWAYAETAFNEKQSAKALADFARSHRYAC